MYIKREGLKYFRFRKSIRTGCGVVPPIGFHRREASQWRWTRPGRSVTKYRRRFGARPGPALDQNTHHHAHCPKPTILHRPLPAGCHIQRTKVFYSHTSSLGCSRSHSSQPGNKPMGPMRAAAQLKDIGLVTPPDLLCRITPAVTFCVGLQQGILCTITSSR
jgi:hypothetical protein